MPSQPLFQNIFILRRHEVAIFADIMKTMTRFIKQVFKDSRKAKRTKNNVLKCNLYADFSRSLEVRHVINIFFGSSLGEV